MWKIDQARQKLDRIAVHRKASMDKEATVPSVFIHLNKVVLLINKVK